jgi:MFS family permease
MENPQLSPPSTVETINLEKLGRERPLIFKSALAEISFCASLILSLASAVSRPSSLSNNLQTSTANTAEAYFISGFHTLLPSLTFSLHIPPGLYTWPSSILTLVAGSTLLPIGRLSDMYGGCIIFNLGFTFFAFSSLLAGFSPNYLSLIAFRALQGLGAAAFLPAGITLMGKIYRPGPRKNFVFSLYGAVSPISFFLGILGGGIAAEKGVWRWYFWFGSITSFLGSLVGWLAIPKDNGEKEAKMDWWGLGTLTPGILLLVFAVTQSSVAGKGWGTPYIYVSAALAVVLLAAGVYVEGYVSLSPFIPGEVLKAPNMKSMLFCLALSYGVFGVFLFYSNF